MRYIADLHVHSHYSRATSKDLNLESLYQWAKIKGINVVGTGDFTHPEWFAELKEKLQPDGNGFFILKDPPKDPAIPGIKTHDIDVRFCLTTEISSIYKHGDRVRKNHNLVYAPNLETVARINHKLSTIGNLEADGRPILGLPSRDLLEIVLETSDRAYLIPAHVWTPWFSTLGSKAGYDSIDACFRDLTDHIFAIETGLSSDPAMNGKVSGLDRFTLISNSDAHSPSKLGREANLLNTELSYDAMFEAFKSGIGLSATYEFYPEEGKYHHDGHRKCGISFDPKETEKYNDICPVCGKPLTVGVLHRVEELADRDETIKSSGFEYIIPLPEVLGEIEGVGPKTKTVTREFQKVISTFGNEFDLMREIPVEDIQKGGGPVLAEAVRRIRTNEVTRNPGFDGVFGEIKVFKEGEIDRIRGQMGFFGLDEYRVEKESKVAESKIEWEETEEERVESSGLNKEQEKVRKALTGATLVKAGPGTGKTHTLIEWLVHQIESGNAKPGEIVAVTFTNKSADELRNRLVKRIGDQAKKIAAGTFHALAWRWLREFNSRLDTLYDSSNRRMILRMLFPDLKRADLSSLNDDLVAYLELGKPVSKESLSMINQYKKYCEKRGAVDLSGLIRMLVEKLREEPVFLNTIRRKYRVLAVDEFQDINPIQYELISLLGKNQTVLAIGDADQSIYGFRGSDVNLFFEFLDDFQANEISLIRNYRSSKKIINGSYNLIINNKLKSGLKIIPDKKSEGLISVHEAGNPFKEADFILDQINKYVGGTESLTSGKHTDSEYSYGFNDIAILFRTHSVGEAIFKSVLKSGIPVHYGDGSSFLSEPPFTIVSHLLKLCLNPDDSIILSELLEENYNWNQSQIQSLIKSLNTDEATLFGSDFEELLDEDLKADLEDLKTVFKSISESLGSEKIAEAIVKICDHYLPDEKLSDPDSLKKETLIELAEESDGDVEDFFEQMQLNPYTDAGRLQSDGIHLLTFHAAKGLEFPVVFIVGAEEGITPLDRDGIDIEEERRLFYVAMTRAEDELQITSSKERVIYGEKVGRQPSRFISEIGDSIITKIESKQSSNSGKPSDSKNKQLGLF
ncbi:UvrD-helicase domain-containing protein [Rhodohalobacter sp. 614A]|uniref:UvrD-helicase domain-containing protein n=1 Tax=Rhodohalobacter sp. 614A TaxID=2908649 RepID=UPI001F3AC664|nr:UvrD-helicase domain-containing protein [Rhodohalobacter sp. 614A]